jgi:hypothetical protein
MPEERGITNIGPADDSEKRAGRPDFVDFRNRIKRLVDSLVELRDPAPTGHFGDSRERVEVKLESEAVIVEFFVAQMPWETTSGLVNQFQDTFAKFTPLFLDANGVHTFKVSKSIEKEGSFRTLYNKEAVLTKWYGESEKRLASISVPRGWPNDHADRRSGRARSPQKREPRSNCPHGFDFTFRNGRAGGIQRRSAGRFR